MTQVVSHKNTTYPFLSLVNNPALVIDVDGQILDANQNWQNLFPKGKKAAKNLFPIIRERNKQEIKDLFDQNTSDQITTISRVGIENGGKIPTTVNMSCLKIDGNLVITAETANVSDMDFFADFAIGGISETVLQTIPAPVFCKNTDHVYTACNDEFLAFIGLPKEEVIGKNVYEVAPSDNAQIYRKADEKLFESGGKQVYETHVKYADGTMHDVVFHKSVFTDDTGIAVGLIGVILDISDRKKIEENLEESQLQLQAIVDNSPSNIFVKDLEGVYRIAGRAFTEKVGWPDKHMLGKTDFEIFPKDIAEILVQNDLDVIESGKAITKRSGFSVNGRDITNLSVRFPLRNSSGDIISVAGVATDISELISAEDKLKQASLDLEKQVKERTLELSEEIETRRLVEEELLQILSSSPVGVGIADMATGKVEFSNARLTELLTPEKENLIGAVIHKHWALQEQRRQYFNELTKTGYVEILEASILREGREPFWANVFGKRIIRNGIEKAVFWIFDLAQIKSAQDEVRKSEMELRKMLAASPVGVGISELKSGNFSFVNESLAELLASTPEELIGDTTLQFWKDIRDRDELIKEFREKGKTIVRELEILKKTGESFWALLSWTRLEIDGKEKIVSWLYDISPKKEAEALLREANEGLEKRVARRTLELEQEIIERKKIEETMRRNEAKFKASADSASDWFWGMDEEFRFNSFSERFEEITGLKQENLLGVRRWEVRNPHINDGQWESHINDLKQHKPFRDFRFTAERNDGGTLHVSISGVPIFDEFGAFTGYRGAGRDVSHEVYALEQSQKMEQQLRQSQKMEAVGQLTGGVAHDFNNILAIILGNIDLIKDEITDKDAIAPFIDAIERSSTRGAQLTQRLLAYSRKQALNPQAVNLNSLVSGMMELVDRLLGETISVHFNLTENLSPVYADAGQVENAVMNLCINSSDAMPDGGDLFIETGNLTVTNDRETGNGELEPGHYNWLSVRDTGTGMTNTMLEHAFEPFYTTKEVGKGTGLGLSMIYGFAKQSKGTVLIESELGTGTQLKIILPTSLLQN